jgi:MinD-like ATPase involved in chromosome partitioning or flagellar assembly
MASSAPGRIFTFYSYKGGTGRSLLLANIAWLLATNGKRVLVVDWDLEAPGLHRYFRPFIVDPDLAETEGLIDLIWTMANDMIAVRGSAASSTPPPTNIDIDNYISPLRWSFVDDGCIDFIGAGRQSATYSERVNTFDWKRFYQLGGRAALNRYRERWRNEYDFVLIDSRTGVSDTSGICTIEMPDAVVACLTLNRQSIDGVSSILRSIRGWEKANARASSADMGENWDEKPVTSSASHGSGRRAIDFFPVATRIENSEKDKLDIARTRVREVFRPFLRPADAQNLRQYWDSMEVTYRPYYAYEEVLAAFGDTTGAHGSARNLASEVESIGKLITGEPNLAMPEITEQSRRQVLDVYALGKSAPQGERAVPSTSPAQQTSVTETLRETADADAPDTLLDEIYAKESRWRNRDYPYRLLLSEREMALIKPDEVAEFGRLMMFYHKESQKFPAVRKGAAYSATIGAILTILTIAAMFVVRLNFPSLLSAGTVYGYGYVIFFCLSPSIAAVRAFLSVQSGSLPFGMQFRDAFILNLMGPLAPPVAEAPRLS